MAWLVGAVFVLQLLSSAVAILYLRGAMLQVVREQRAHEVALVRDGLLEAYYDGGRRELLELIRRRAHDRDVFIALTGRGPPLLVNLTAPPRVRAAAGAIPIAVWRPGADEPQRGVAMVRHLPGGEVLTVGAEVASERRFARAFAEAAGFTLAVAVALALLSALVLGLVVSRSTREIAETAGRLGSGDFAARVPPGAAGDGFNHLRRQMNLMAERIDRLVSELRSISGALAHDLRSPVARLSAALDTAAARVDQPQAAEALAAARADADSLRAMLENAIELTRLEGGAVTPRREPLDCDAVAADLAELYEPLAEAQGKRLETALSPVRVDADRQLLSRALANLIDNALKYGGPRILVSTAASGEWAQITVADDGPGIAAADRARAVERFIRLDAARSRPGGGLGLAMVDAVARLHGGSLMLAGEHGLVATLRLPR